MSLSDAVRALNEVRRDRDELQIRLAAKENEVSDLKKQLQSQLKSSKCTNNGSGSAGGCECNCHLMVEFALEQFQTKLDALLQRIEGNLTLDFSPSKMKVTTSAELSSISTEPTTSYSANSLRAKLSKAAKRTSRQSNVSNSSEKEKLTTQSPIGDETESNVSNSTSISLDATVKALSFLSGNARDKTDSSSLALTSPAASPEKNSSQPSISPPWTEVAKFSDTPAFDLDSPTVIEHLKHWSPNTEKRLYLCQWLQNFISNHNPESQNEDLLLRGLTSEAKESFIIIIIPILRDKRPDIPLYAYYRESSLSVGIREVGAYDDFWDLKLTTTQCEEKILKKTDDNVLREKYSDQIEFDVISEWPDTENIRGSYEKGKGLDKATSPSISVIVSDEENESKPSGTPPRSKMSPSSISPTRLDEENTSNTAVSPPKSNTSPSSISPRRRRIGLTKTGANSSRSNNDEKSTTGLPPRNKTSDLLTDAINLSKSNLKSADRISKETSSKMEEKPPRPNSSGMRRIERLNKNIALTSRVQATLENLQANQGEI